MALAGHEGLTPSASAQRPGVHYGQNSLMSPGAIGNWQLLRGGPLPGYFQPVEIRAPEGALISLAVDGAFDDPRPSPLRVGLLIAPVYRLRVTDIPAEAGREVFPTIEVINRLYPPAGQAARFPVPIEITQEDLELVLAGKFVTRVIYLEDPESALPVAQTSPEPQQMDAGVGEDPLEVADRLGRPMAILRIGGRQPLESEGDDELFVSNCAPFKLLPLRPKDGAVEEVSVPQEAGRKKRTVQSLPTAISAGPPLASPSNPQARRSR